jgi:hypothetical protein
MLPGFRFLFAAILLSMSILIFGLGAAALLRAAHEEFASNPSWRAGPETMFAQQAEATRPVLAMLRVEPAAEETKPSEITSAIAVPAEQAAAAAQAPTEQAAAPPPEPGPEGIAALGPVEASPPEAARPEFSALESPAQSETAAPAPAPAAADANKNPAPTAADEAKVASTEQALPPSQARPASSGQASVQASPETDSIATKIAALGDSAITVEAPPAKAVSAKPDRIAAKKRLQARRAAHRRRLAALARQAQLARQLLQQQSDPFAQTTPSPPVVPPRPSTAVAAPLQVAPRKH